MKLIKINKNVINYYKLHNYKNKSREYTKNW